MRGFAGRAPHRHEPFCEHRQGQSRCFQRQLVPRRQSRDRSLAQMGELQAMQCKLCVPLGATGYGAVSGVSLAVFIVYRNAILFANIASVPSIAVAKSTYYIAWGSFHSCLAPPQSSKPFVSSPFFPALCDGGFRPSPPARALLRQLSPACAVLTTGLGCTMPCQLSALSLCLSPVIGGLLLPEEHEHIISSTPRPCAAHVSPTAAEHTEPHVVTMSYSVLFFDQSDKQRVAW